MILYSILFSVLVASFSIHAAESLRCSVTLLQPLPDDGSMGYYVPPESKVISFDYDPSQEKTVYITSRVAVPPRAGWIKITQHSLAQTKSADDSKLSIEFSKTKHDGGKYVGDAFGVYLRPKEDPAHPAWIGYQLPVSTSTIMELSEAMKGYVVLTCLPRW